MNYIQAQILNQMNSSRDWINGVQGNISQGIHHQIQRTKNGLIDLNTRCQRAMVQIKQSCIDTVDRIKEFLHQHKETLFFTGCCITTAYFCPSLFFSGFLIAFAGRIELASYGRSLANHYLKDEVNPYRLNPNYTICVNTINLGIGTLAAIDSVGIGTIFMANTWTLCIIPFLGGVTAGDSAAKFWMNTTNFLG